MTRTLSGTTVIVKPPATTPEPGPVGGTCPYLDDDVVFFLTGQHYSQTQLINVKPDPICMFYRSDGGWLATVRIVHAATAPAAVAAVNQHVPVGQSQPAGQPAGWTGGSTTRGSKIADANDALSVYAVSKGNVAVVAEENETPSIKARSIAVCAIYGAHLESGTAPDYCRPE